MKPPPRLFGPALVPGIITDNTVTGSADTTITFPIEIQQTGEYSLLLVSNSRFDSRLVEIEVNGIRQTLAIDSGKNVEFYLGKLSAGHLDLHMTPHSPGVSIRHMQMVLTGNNFSGFPEIPSIVSFPVQFGQIPGFVYDSSRFSTDGSLIEGSVTNQEIEILESGGIPTFFFFGQVSATSPRNPVLMRISLNNSSRLVSFNDDITQVLFDFGRQDAGIFNLRVEVLEGDLAFLSGQAKEDN